MSGSGQDSAQPTHWLASQPAARPEQPPTGQPAEGAQRRTSAPAANDAENATSRTRARVRAMTLATLTRLGVPPSLARDALLIFALTRIGFIGLTIGVMILKLHQTPSLGGFITLWARFDATYYARLARDGYSAHVPYRAAFFPLQPMLTAVVRPLIGGNIYLASIIVSNLAFLVALFGMAALLAPPLGHARSPWTAWSATLREERRARGERENALSATALAHAREGGAALAASDAAQVALAQRAMLYLALYPMALFLFAGYADSLFLALAIWCLVALRRKAWLAAGLLGLLATMTRQMGLFLALPFAYDYLTAIRWRPRAIRFGAAAILLIPTGLLLFMAWLWHSMGDPLAFLHAEKYWGHSFMLPWSTIASAIPAILHENYLPLLYKDALDLMMVVVFLALIIIGAFGVFGAQRQRLGDTAYSAAIWLLAICYPAVGWALQSDARYMLLAIPCFVTLAQLGRRRWLHALILIVWLLLLLVTTQYFLRGNLII